MFVLSDGLDLNVRARVHTKPRKRNHKKERQPAIRKERVTGWLSFFLVVSFFFLVSLVYARAV